MSKVPPLNALKAFESAARHGSYVAAARDLGVTPAAVSQQVRRLEDHMGRRLFTRFNNRVVLTDAGQSIFAGIAQAFADLAALTDRAAAAPSRKRLVVSVLPSLCDCWFLPRFAGFHAIHPEVQLDLRIEDDPVDFATGDLDVRLCYGAALYAELRVIPLFTDEVLPLCAPALLKGDGQLEWSTVSDAMLIHTNWGPNFASQPGWTEWFRKHEPGRAPDAMVGHRVNRSRLALDFAGFGFGVALGQRQLAGPDLKAGRLVIGDGRAVPLGQAYCAAVPHMKMRKADVARLVAFLQTSA